MNEAEYRIMDYVVTYPTLVRQLLPDSGEDADDHFAVAFNRPSHGLASQEVTDVLLGLFNKNYLIAQWCNFDFEPQGDFFEPTYEQIQVALATPRAIREQSNAIFLHYQLTSLGGEAWEAVSQVDWNLFLTREEAYGDTWHDAFADDLPTDESQLDAVTMTVTQTQASDMSLQEDEDATKRLHVRIASEHHGLVANLFSLDKHYFKVVVVNSEQWSEITPWQATYWKLLPQAYKVCYSIYSNSELQSKGDYIKSHSKLSAHGLRMATSWYTDYITGRRLG